MTEYIHLIGTEDIARAGHNMQSAAGEMAGAASSIEDSMGRHRQFMDDWLDRLEQVLKQNNTQGGDEDGE